MNLPLPPSPTPEAGRAALRLLLSERSLLPALAALQGEMGAIFSLSFPGFKPVVLSGPEAARFALVEARASLAWRNESDPVTGLLRGGVLVQDGQAHDELRRLMNPFMHRKRLEAYIPGMVRWTDFVLDSWQPDQTLDGQTLDMLVEMRKAALLIIMDTLFAVDFTPDLERLFPAILRVLKFISPGLWLVWKGAPRPGFGRAIGMVNEYLYRLIADRRQNPGSSSDLLSSLAANPEMSDDLIRDQLLTLLIAGHDTSTALLAWCLYALGRHPDVYARVCQEVDAVLEGRSPDPEDLPRLVYLGQVISETLRMYPPIHVGNRVVLEDLAFNGYRIPAGRRLMVSIYATHHDPRLWPDPARFDPDRFAPGVKHAPYSYLPFGGGPRNCIGAAFAEVKAKAVLARLLQRFEVALEQDRVGLYMGATLEPRPGVFVRVTPRR